MNNEYFTEISTGLADENGVIKLSLVDGFPQQLAAEFVNPNMKPVLAISQARTIFNCVNNTYLRFNSGRISFDEAKAELLVLKSTINNKANKQQPIIPKSFCEFYEAAVAQVNAPADLKFFKLHMEAICNYLKDAPKSQGQFKPNGNRDNHGGYRSNYNNNYRK